MTMIQWMAIIFPIALMVIAFWQKKLWIFILSGIAWFMLAAYGFMNVDTDAVYEYYGWFGIAGALVQFLAPLWLRPRREPEPTAPSRRDLYEARLERELDLVRYTPKQIREEKRYK